MSSSERISLADISRLNEETQTWRWDGSIENDAVSPTLGELSEFIQFSPGDGRIWLDDRRVVLMQSDALGMMRQQLIDKVGLDDARGLLTRTGYISGVRDAELVMARWADQGPMSTYLAGVRLHALEGMVKVEPLHLEFDAAMGTYSGEFIWHNSVEVEAHIAHCGMGSEPACWTQLGYAMGYVSTTLGRLVIFREVECRAAGGQACRIIGKPAEEWPNVEEDLHYINGEDFLSTSAFNPSSARDIAELPEVTDNLAAEDEKHMVGISAAFNACCHQLKRVAPTRATALFSGESGVGKELFAQMLHEISPRKDKPFVSVNCAAIPDTLVEAELFGVEQGAYTGAIASRPGRFERADGGTLFLDEIGTLSLVSQGKLLRALQEGVIERVGGTREIRVDVRVVAATNVELEEEVRQGRFREDLFFRLNVFPVRLPPLRDRREDIPLLLSYFLQRYSQQHGRHITGFTARAVRALLNYDYPGNIRELQNLVERGVISADDDNAIDLRHLFRFEQMPSEFVYSVGIAGGLAKEDANEALTASEAIEGGLLDRFLALSQSESLSLESLELRLIQEAVERCRGNLAAAARMMGLSRAQLAYRLSKA
ncbi:sigma 54-interacting transcriptional regulator [Amphritea pacifica]|uniref:Sigma 54-interacting transcriptional regulator n=1 Tax=Amphritea pacifica TaxID=2811233 RepID=A0ABS2W8D5_9GAMM|nr:sigma-54-dependent Fis family transcriptional regulator [Amphritea pacifica]MBN0987980.1 sigma 54-interacting transcriptional regulator [Amphritea pacifica]MBN1005628.1 sigma 54-interacting transcriptional regulator [Amphritea pacifica]